MIVGKKILTLGAVLLWASASPASELQACWKQHPPETQIINCSKIIDRKPSVDVLADALLHRGSAYAAKGMLSESIADYSQAIKIKPGNDQALSGRAQSYLKARKFELAVTDYSAAIKVNGKLAAAYVGRGYAYLVNGKPEMAIADFTAALKVSPSYVAALNNRGLAYKKLGKLGSALSDFTRAISINPLYALAYNNRGYVFEAVGDKAKAVDDFRNALAIDPSLVAARDALVRLSAAGNIAAVSSNRIANGKRLAQKGCAWCHAIGVTGKSPNRRAPRFGDIHSRHPILSLRQPITRAIVTPHDAMPKLTLTPKEIDTLIAYINSLRTAK